MKSQPRFNSFWAPILTSPLTVLSTIALSLTLSLSWAQPAVQAPHGGIKIPAPQQAQIIRVKIDDLRPGQPVVGGLQIVEDKADLQKKRGQKSKTSDENRLDEYLRNRPVPLMRTPYGELYMIDGHHMVRAYHELGGTEVFAYIAFDYFANRDLLDRAKFAQYAAEYGFVYLIDAEGNRLENLYAIPRHIKDLADDPYRALAKMVLKRGGFNKTDISHAELYWGDFFRSELRKLGIPAILDSSGAISSDVLERATSLAADPNLARNMPGFKN